MELGFSHTLNPPVSIVDQLLIERMRKMPVEKQRELLDLM